MGWLGLSLACTIIIVIITHFVCRNGKWASTEEYLTAAIVGFIASAFLIAIIGGLFIGLNEGKIYKNDPIPTECRQHINSWDIISAVRDESVSSSFILGTGGSTRVDRYYVYRVELEGMMLTDYNAHRTFVVEQDGRPRYERIDYICPRPIAEFLWFGDDWERWNTGRTGTLYVPTGTILREFRL